MAPLPTTCSQPSSTTHTRLPFAHLAEGAHMTRVGLPPSPAIFTKVGCCKDSPLHASAYTTFPSVPRLTWGRTRAFVATLIMGVVKSRVALWLDGLIDPHPCAIANISLALKACQM